MMHHSSVLLLHLMTATKSSYKGQYFKKLNFYWPPPSFYTPIFIFPGHSDDSLRLNSVYIIICLLEIIPLWCHGGLVLLVYIICLLFWSVFFRNCGSDFQHPAPTLTTLTWPWRPQLNSWLIMKCVYHSYNMTTNLVDFDNSAWDSWLALRFSLWPWPCMCVSVCV